MLPKVVSTISNVAPARSFASITLAMGSRATPVHRVTRVHRFDPVPPVVEPTPPIIEQAPVSQTVVVGQSVTFIVRAFGEGPLSYQWLRNDADIPGATASSYTLPLVTTADNGARFAVRVSSASGAVTSAAASVTVQTVVQKSRQKGAGSLMTPRIARPRK